MSCRVFNPETVVPDFRRYRSQWETALMALALYEHVNGTDRERCELAKAWFAGFFNGCAAHVQEGAEDGFRSLEWHQTGPTHFDLVYTAPYGLKCALGRVYHQPNDSWAATVIAGVGDDPHDAMSRVEWAVSRLCS